MTQPDNLRRQQCRRAELLPDLTVEDDDALVAVIFHFMDQPGDYAPEVISRLCRIRTHLDTYRDAFVDDLDKLYH